MCHGSCQRLRLLIGGGQVRPPGATTRISMANPTNQLEETSPWVAPQILPPGKMIVAKASGASGVHLHGRGGVCSHRGQPSLAGIGCSDVAFRSGRRKVTRSPRMWASSFGVRARSQRAARPGNTLRSARIYLPRRAREVLPTLCSEETPDISIFHSKNLPTAPYWGVSQPSRE